MENVKTRIYFDTNKLECRFKGDNLFLSEIKLNTLFYSIVQLIENLNLKDNVEICIPEVVIMELKKHMYDKYKSCSDSFKNKVEEMKNVFGSLIDVDYEYRGARNLQEYQQYLEEIFKNFIDYNDNILIVEAPKEERVFNKILDKAVFTKKPFQEAKGKTKQFSDAGFKDALISETIIENSKGLNSIFLTDDHDFKDVFGQYNNIVVMENSDDVEDYLIKTYDVDIKTKYYNTFIHNKYLIQTILVGCGYDENSEFKVEKLMDCIIDDETGQMSFKIIASINGKLDSIFVKYDPIANELIEYYNEGENEIK